MLSGHSEVAKLIERRINEGFLADLRVGMPRAQAEARRAQQATVARCAGFAVQSVEPAASGSAQPTRKA